MSIFDYVFRNSDNNNLAFFENLKTNVLEPKPTKKIIGKTKKTSVKNEKSSKTKKSKTSKISKSSKKTKKTKKTKKLAKRND